MAPPVLEIQDLSIEFQAGANRARVVDEVSFQVQKGQIVGLIGESGSGKSTIALAILRLMPRGAIVANGSIRLNGISTLPLSESEMRKLRGSQVAFIPQNAMSSFNPLLSVGEQVGEPLTIHDRIDRRAATKESVDLLRSVHLRDPERSARDYPHRLSGGMLQRAMIAMALSMKPSLIVADEPTTALDVTVQSQILNLLKEVRDQHSTSVLLITHDLAVAAQTCDWLVVIYAARVLESGPTAKVLSSPQHPYTQALLKATPRLNGGPTELSALPGQLPSPWRLPSGCRFADRCSYRFEKCAIEPQLLGAAGHLSRCWLSKEA